MHNTQGHAWPQVQIDSSVLLVLVVAHSSAHVRQVPLTLRVAPLMRSMRVSSFLSWWWLPLPLLMISTPARARLMWGALNVKTKGIADRNFVGVCSLVSGLT
jgi:hypothetical protein